MPPLRDREHDALFLAEIFLQEASARSSKTGALGVHGSGTRALLAYRWPGNVRELKNALDYAVTVAAFDHLSESDLPEAVHARRSYSGDTARRRSTLVRGRATTHRGRAALGDGNRARAARLLGIDRRTLHRKLDRLAIDVPPRSQPGVRLRGTVLAAR